MPIPITKDQEMAAWWKSQQHRFFAKVIPEPNSGCWLWEGALNTDGYGLMGVSQVVTRAHRISYEVHKGPIPLGLFVCHTCDVKSCVNPDHLYAGTRRQNVDDAVQRLRFKTRKGQASNRAKISDVQAREILEAEGSQRHIAKKYGLSQTAISYIKRGKRFLGSAV